MYSASPTEPTVTEAALIEGSILYEGDCLYMEDDEVIPRRSQVLWPYGTSWQEEPPGIVLPSGELVRVGGTISGGGGYYLPGDLARFTTNTAVSELARSCSAGEAESVAVLQGGPRRSWSRQGIGGARSITARPAVDPVPAGRKYGRSTHVGSPVSAWPRSSRQPGRGSSS